MGAWRNGSALPWHGRGWGFKSPSVHFLLQVTYCQIQVYKPKSIRAVPMRDSTLEKKKAKFK